MLREFCAENFTLVPRAIAAGAQRIELCDNLAVGGTTPSRGVIAKTVACAHARGARVMCMIRPRGGDFCYAPDELDIMEEDIKTAIELGCDGIVLGCLRHGRRDAWELDGDALVCLLACTRPCEVTFHMAFDELGPSAQLAAIDELAALGCTRILTHGGPAGTPIEGNAARLRELQRRAGARLRILPGAGITHENAAAIAAATGAEELHGTKIVRL